MRKALGSLALADAKLGNKDRAIAMLDLAVSKDPSNVRPAGRLIAVFAAKGDSETAKEIARDISERLPSSAEAATLRAQVSLSAGDFADADVQISRALSLKRDFHPALALRLRREIMNRDRQGAEQTVEVLAQSPEKQLWAAYARLLFSEGKVDAGIKEFDRVLREHPGDPGVRDEYASLLLGAGRRNQGEERFTATLAKNPKDSGALLMRATVAIDEGNLDQAAKDIKTLQDLKKFTPALSYEQSRLYAARGETTHQGDALAEALRANPGYLAARLDLSRLLITLGKPKDAVDILDQARPIQKTTIEYVYFRNNALMAAGDWDGAAKEIGAALKASPSGGFLYQDALLRLRKNDLAGARKSLDLAFRMMPSDPGIVNLLGEVMRRQGQSKEYLAILKDAAGKHPQSITLERALGNVLATLGDRNGARTAFEASKAAGDTDADFEIALLDLQAGAGDQARQELLDLVKRHDTAKSELLLAAIDSKRGPDVVIQHYLKAVSLEPQNGTAMNNLAEFLSRQNKFDDALFWGQKALAQTPNSPVVEDTSG